MYACLIVDFGIIIRQKVLSKSSLSKEYHGGRVGGGNSTR